ncbi:hypothetical protein [Streptomyces abikoensis]|uniref:hypothetical protein n=1 Tax=Streptomyces abikoensis TaxID=97398 RepID=UPI0019963CE5|nr:hypothetical protein [Streptomyces abikoensis]GGP59244.1 hypothetical protein GCM10010214_36270 [Streptomyces abikoensis]
MTLPVPIEFLTPEGWLPADLGKAGAADVAFAAVHPQPDAGFAANITVDGEYRPDTATLTELADESVERLRDVAESVVVTDCREIGSSDAPALIQRLVFSVGFGDARRELVQSQVYLSMLDVADSRERAVVRLALTATVAQHDAVLGDFQDFVRTVRPDTGTGIR